MKSKPIVFLIMFLCLGLSLLEAQNGKQQTKPTITSTETTIFIYQNARKMYELKSQKSNTDKNGVIVAEVVNLVSLNNPKFGRLNCGHPRQHFKDQLKVLNL